MCIYVSVRSSNHKHTERIATRKGAEQVAKFEFPL